MKDHLLGCRNGPEGRVLLPKKLFLSNINKYQTSASKSWVSKCRPNFNLKMIGLGSDKNKFDQDSSGLKKKNIANPHFWLSWFWYYRISFLGEKVKCNTLWAKSNLYQYQIWSGNAMILRFGHPNFMLYWCYQTAQLFDLYALIMTIMWIAWLSLNFKLQTIWVALFCCLSVCLWVRHRYNSTKSPTCSYIQA